MAKKNLSTRNDADILWREIKETNFNVIKWHCEKISNGQLDFFPTLKKEISRWLKVSIDDNFNVDRIDKFFADYRVVVVRESGIEELCLAYEYEDGRIVADYKSFIRFEQVNFDSFYTEHPAEDWVLENRRYLGSDGEFKKITANKWKFDVWEKSISGNLKTTIDNSDTSLVPAPTSDLDGVDPAVDTATASTEQPSLEKLTAEIAMYLHIANQSVIEVGKRLIVAKELVAHGEWANWLEKNFKLTIRSAQRFIAVANRFSNTTTSSYFDVSTFKASTLLELLALPTGEEEKFIAAKADAGTPVVDMTVKTLRDEIKNYKADLKKVKAERDDFKQSASNLEKQLANRNSELNDAKLRADNLSTQLANHKPVEVVPADYESLKKEVADLRSRPVEVATEFPADYASTKKELAELKERENSFQRDFEVRQALVQLFGLLPTLLNADNLKNAVAELAGNDTKAFEGKLGQLQQTYFKIFQALIDLTEVDSKPVDRKAIRRELLQMVVNDTSKRTSVQLSQWVNDWGYKMIDEVPDDKLVTLLNMARDFQKSLATNT